MLVSGQGFEANTRVDIYFDKKDETHVITDGQGRFKDVNAYAPRSARPGQYWVTALERNNDKRAQKPFLVQTNWTQFHFEAGGTRLNPYENVLYTKNAGDLSLKWGYVTAGSSINSSPAVVNGVVYIGSCADLSGYVYALDARTGDVKWVYTTGGCVGSEPAVVDGVVYVGSDDWNVYALNAASGHLLWSYATGYWVVAAPAVANGMVYIGSYDGYFYALDARTGAKLWSYRFGTSSGGYVAASAVVVNGVVYDQSEDGTLRNL